MAEKGVFLRKASGLVRDISAFDSWVINLGYSAIWWSAMLLLTTSWVSPKGDLALGPILCMVGVLFMGAVYAFFAAAMPRSGGDYIWVSRTIHPSIGFAENLIIIIFGLFWLGATPVFLLWHVSSVLASVGKITGDAMLTSWAAILYTPINAFIISAIIIMIFGSLSILRLKQYLRLQNVLMLIIIVSMIIVVGVMATNTLPQFIGKFNAIVGPNSYETMIKDATAGGLESSIPISLFGTLGIMPIAYWSMSYPFYSTYLSGEVKKPAKSSLIAITGTLLWNGCWLGTFGLLAMRVFGHDFINSLGYLYYVMPDKYLLDWSIYFPPVFLLSVLTSNPIFWWLIGIIGVCLQIIFIPLTIIWSSRCLLAWSFDRLVPAQVGEVSPRYHTPVKATIIVMILGIIFTAIYLYFYTFIASLAVIIGQMIFAMLIVGLAAIVFPFRKKDIFERSPLNHRIGKLPLMTLFAIVQVAFMAIVAYLYLSNPSYGGGSLVSIGLIGAVFVAGIIYYFTIRAYKKRKGVDIDLAFKEIPPE